MHSLGISITLYLAARSMHLLIMALTTLLLYDQLDRYSSRQVHELKRRPSHFTMAQLQVATCHGQLPARRLIAGRI